MKYLGPPQSGSQAGTTASHNRAGQYFRNRRTPVTPTRTPKQGVLRAAFGSVSAAWQSLDALTQASWTSFAAGYPIVDSLGQSIVLTGHQYFVGVNTSLLNAGSALITTPPTDTTLNPVAPASIYADAGGAVLLFYTAPVAGDFVLAAASKVLSGGRFFNKAFSQFGVDSSAAGVQDISDQYADQFGVPLTGKRIFGRLTAVNASGMSASPVIVNTTVVAGSVLNFGVITSAVAGQVVLAGADMTATSGDLYFVNPVTGLYTYIASQPVVAGAATWAGVPSGDTVAVRVTDGVTWSARTASIVVM